MAALAYTAGKSDEKKPYIPLENGWWRKPLFYMLSLSLVGLGLYPALGISLVFLAHEWRHDRYNFLIMLTLLVGTYGLMSPQQLPIWTSDLALLAAGILWFVYRKPPILRRTLTAIFVYFGFMFIVAFLSVENMKIQLLVMRFYWHILYIIIPIAIFSGKEFDFNTFILKLFPFVLLIAIFYLADAYIISGHIFLPKDTSWNGSTFYSPSIHLLSGKIYRIYPPGIFLYSLIFLPILRTYRLHWWQWLFFIGSLIACQTFTIIIGFLAVYVLFQANVKKIATWSIAGIVLFTGLYFIDGMMPEVKHDDGLESRLRIKSSIDQFFDLYNAVDEEDIAEFGSGRMAQALPKLEIVAREGRQWIGLGFLHPSKTTLNQYLITNEYYSDIEKADEVATSVEIAQIQVYINMGWLGLLVVTLFYLYLYYLVRKLPYSYYCLSVMALCFIWSAGGFAGINFDQGGQLIAISFAAVVLHSRDKLGFNTPWIKKQSGRQTIGLQSEL